VLVSQNTAVFLRDHELESWRLKRLCIPHDLTTKNTGNKTTKTIERDNSGPVCSPVYRARRCSRVGASRLCEFWAWSENVCVMGGESGEQVENEL